MPPIGLTCFSCFSRWPKGFWKKLKRGRQIPLWKHRSRIRGKNIHIIKSSRAVDNIKKFHQKLRALKTEIFLLVQFDNKNNTLYKIGLFKSDFTPYRIRTAISMRFGPKPWERPSKESEAGNRNSMESEYQFPRQAKCVIKRQFIWSTCSKIL